MAEAILVPQVGQDLTEAKIVKLNVKLGDVVKKGDIVAEVESEKATFEVEAFVSGVVVDLPFQEGDVGTVLEPLLHVGEAGETVGGAQPAAAPAAAPAPAVAAPAPAVAEKPVLALATGAAVHAAAQAQEAGVLRASPLARRLAAAKGLDLAALKGTGPRGAVVMRDIDSALARRGAGPAQRLAQQVGATGALTLKTLQEGTGVPVVFIHGFGSELSSWRPFIGRVGVGNPMIGIDLPAHGGSASREADSFAGLVDEVAAALAGAGYARLHLVGHSLGGAVAAALADRGDLDVRSLTLIAPAGLGPRIDGEFLQGFLGAASEPALAAWMQRLVDKPASLPGALIRATLAARDGTGLANAQSQLARGLFEGSTQLFSIREALERYAGPARIVLGRRDAVIPVEHAETVPGHVAVHRLDAVGHLPQLEAAALVGRLVAETVRAAG